jgi:hypothetical protein
MTAHHQIFIRTGKSEQELIADLSATTGADISAVRSTSNSVVYSGSASDTVVDVELHHEFDDDRGMKFSSYPVLVTIRELGGDRSIEERTARTLFDELKAIGGYELLVVFNLQKLVAQS